MGEVLLLYCFELEFHNLAADDEAEVVLPESAKAGEMVDPKLETKPAPEGQEADSDGNFPESGGTVVVVSAVVGAEVAEREAVEVPAMGGVAEGAEVGVVRRYQEDAPGWADDAMEFLHGANDIGHVLDDMDGAQGVEGVIAERIRKTVEVAEDIGAAAWVAIDSDGAGMFMDAAPDVQCATSATGRSYATRFRHSSSVSTAKSA